MVLYYTQRASAGLIISEGINISEQAKGSPGTPGLFTREQIDSWKKVTEAGFDGVELHAAFGYLPNQFLAESSNQRTDEYGGSIENRNRFVLEVMHQLVDALGEGKVGIKLSPAIPYNNIIHQDPMAQFTTLIGALDEMPLAYIHLMNAGFPADQFPHYPENILETFGTLTRHTVIGNMGYDRETGEQELEKGIAKMISYGALFLANPDLPKRFELKAALNQPDRATMYGGGEHGYTDYPFLNANR